MLYFSNLVGTWWQIIFKGMHLELEDLDIWDTQTVLVYIALTTIITLPILSLGYKSFSWSNNIVPASSLYSRWILECHPVLCWKILSLLLSFCSGFLQGQPLCPVLKNIFLTYFLLESMHSGTVILSCAEKYSMYAFWD